MSKKEFLPALAIILALVIIVAGCSPEGFSPFGWTIGGKEVFDVIYVNEVRATGSGGWELADDAGNAPIHIVDGGTVDITQTATSGIGVEINRDLASGSTDSEVMAITNANASDDQAGLVVTQYADDYAIKVWPHGTAPGILVDQTNGTRTALKVYSNQGAGQEWPLVDMHVANPDFDQELWYIKNEGAGSTVKLNNDGTGTGIDVDHDTVASAIDVRSGVTSEVSSPLVYFEAEEITFDETVLYLKQDGTGDILQAFDGSVKAFSVEDGGGAYVKATSGTILELADQSQARYVFNRDTGGGVKLEFKSGIAQMVSDGTWELESAGGSLIKMKETGGGNEIHYDPSTTTISGSNGALNVELGSNAGDDFTVDTDKLVVEGDTGNVGINTPNPGNTLEVSGTISAATSITAGNTMYAGGVQLQGQFYGVMWDESADTYTRTGLLADEAASASPGDSALPIQSQMRRCILSDAGEVQYYLNPYDSTKKVDGTASDLTGADGQVMVEIPAFWYRYEYSGTTHRWDISEHPYPGFTRHPAFVKNGANVDYRYIGAYEGVLYDTSASTYTNGIYQTAFSCTFAQTDSSITANARTAPFAQLGPDDKLSVTGTVSNNNTFTVSSVASDTKIIVAEAVVTETAASTVIQTQKDWANDVLASVSGYAAINYGTRANFRAAAASRGTGWRQQDFYLTSAVQLLYLVEYADFYSQSMIGNGLTDWASGTWSTYNDYNPINATGLSNGDGDVTANVSGGDGVVGSYMNYRGIENWFGHIWKWVDGFNVNSNVPYFSNTDTDFADDTATNYDDPGITLHNANGYQGALEQIDEGFLPADVTGTATTKITDYYWQASGWRVLLFGADADNGADGGGFAYNADDASGGAHRDIGARLAF